MSDVNQRGAYDAIYYCLDTNISGWQLSSVNMSRVQESNLIITDIKINLNISFVNFDISHTCAISVIIFKVLLEKKKNWRIPRKVEFMKLGFLNIFIFEVHTGIYE